MSLCEVLKRAVPACGQVLEAEELEGLLYAELRRTPKAGEQFAAACRTILARETK